MFPVSLDCPFLIALSVFPNVYFIPSCNINAYICESTPSYNIYAYICETTPSCHINKYICETTPSCNIDA